MLTADQLLVHSFLDVLHTLVLYCHTSLCQRGDALVLHVTNENILVSSHTYL